MPARKPSKQYHAPPLAPFSQQDGKMGAVRTCRRFFEQLAVACAVAGVACGGGGPRPQPGAAPAGGGSPGGPGRPGAAVPASAVVEMQRLYRGMGLIAGSAALPFVASVGFLTSPSPDTTLTLVSLSLPSRALGFAREGERYTASYAARLELRQGQAIIRQLEATETVRVPTFRETARTDESVIWQQFLRLPPGRYNLAVSVKDGSSIRGATEDVILDVPRLPSGGLATPIPVYEVIPRTTGDSLPRLLARPRASVVFGQDSVFPLYIDNPAPTAPERLRLRALGDGDVLTWDTTFTLDRRGAGRSATIAIPVSRLAIGVNTLQLLVPGTTDEARTRVFVSLGDDLPIAGFEEMLGYLRYFTTPERLRALRDAPLAGRGEAWATFLKATDPVPATAEHEGLRDYFARIRTANVRYRDDGQVGWQSDRGTAYVALGDPDNLYDSGAIDPNARVRQQIWEYRELRLQLLFIDQSGFGRWRLNPSSRSELDNAIRRKLALFDR